MAPTRPTRTLLHLAFSHFGRPPSPPASAPSPVSALLDADIRRVALVRHGNTAPPPDGASDFDRRLTDLGRSQARSAGGSYGAELLRSGGGYHPRALCSPAPRCVETAEIFLEAARSEAGEEGSTATPELVPVPSLYDGTMQPEGSRLFRMIGYAPLRDYLYHPDASDRDAARAVLGDYACAALGAMGTEASSSPSPAGGDGRTLLLFAHAVYLPSAALGLAEACGCSGGHMDLALSTNTREAEGYLVDVAEKSVGLLCRPEEP